MSKMNVLVSISAYSDVNPTNHPSKNICRWISDLQGIDIAEPVSSSVALAAGQTLSLFSGEVVISDDNTTTYNLSLKSGTSNTYILQHNSGTAPIFRVARVSGADATTEVTITKNGPLLTFSSTAGTALDLTTTLINDEVRIGSLFNISNQGKFKVLSKTATSFTIENSFGQAEGPIVLGAGFATQIAIQSANGVQVGEKVKIAASFSSVSFGSYEITDVDSKYLELYSLKALPSETNIFSNLQIFNNSKQFLFIESDKKVSIEIDGGAGGSIEPFTLGTTLKSGMFLRHSAMYSASITNESSDTATVYYMSAE